MYILMKVSNHVYVNVYVYIHEYIYLQESNLSVSYSYENNAPDVSNAPSVIRRSRGDTVRY